VPPLRRTQPRSSTSDVQVGACAKSYEHDVDAWRRAIECQRPMMAEAVAPALVAQGWGRIVNHQPFPPW
jgi:hypothetical protein